MDRIQIKKELHFQQEWRVHKLLQDFELEDLWQVPVTLKEEHTLAQFLDQFLKSNDRVVKAGSLAGLLFKFRLWLGKIFKWDEKPLIDHLLPGSIRERYAKAENLSFENLPEPGNGDFIPVYQLENEYLSEIENETVHAALHLGRIRKAESFIIHMAVYVKPKGFFGSAYMKLIKPFRHWIVYPALMKSARQTWERFLNKEKELEKMA